MKIEVITFQDWRKMGLDKKDVIVTVSKSETWSRGLSPFYVGPCKLYEDYTAKNVENAWQFSKVYSEFIQDDVIQDGYFKWADKGWKDKRAWRYPMGKGSIPEFSYWDGDRLDYIAARKKIYIPLYYQAVKDTEAFSLLQSKYDEYKEKDKDLYLVDFDAYRHHELGFTYKDVVNCPEKKMGHAFVLAMALEEPVRLAKTINKLTGV